MPVDDWSRMKGLFCHMCDGPATHQYGNILLCCDCHAGKDNGLLTRAEAERIHRGEPLFPQEYTPTPGDFDGFVF